MEKHPIPQDVTGFQFKLIGDMTVKQFAYLAVGATTGWIVFSLPISFFISVPVSAICVATGISLAFIPIAGRPVDVMLANFIKSLFSPTQYVYRQSAIDTRMPLQSGINFGTSLTKPASATSTYNQPKTQEAKMPLAKTTSENKNEELQKKENELEEKLEEIKIEEEKLKKEKQENNSSLAEEAHKKLLALEQQLQETLAQKEELSKQIADLKKKFYSDKKNVFVPSSAKLTIPQTPNVKKIPWDMSKKVGLPTTPTAPNIVSGIVKNPRGNPLANILVEIRDKQDNPARAFKTNQIGYFASATPLANGVYTLIFEDPKGVNKFDTIEISLENKIIMPIEVVSVDPREELRRSLFEDQSK